MLVVETLEIENFVDSMLDMADSSYELSGWSNTDTGRFKMKGAIIIWIRLVTSTEVNP